MSSIRAATLALTAIVAANCAPAEKGPKARPAQQSHETVAQTMSTAVTADDPREQAESAHTSAARAAADRLDFGAIPLGTPIRALPRGASWQPGCDATRVEGCGFDLDGVRYGTDWENNIVVIKTIGVGDARPDRLPFGLRGDETMDEALASLNAQFNGAFEIGGNDTGERFVIAYSGNARLEQFEVSLFFKRGGRLSEVRVSCCYN